MCSHHVGSRRKPNDCSSPARSASQNSAHRAGGPAMRKARIHRQTNETDIGSAEIDGQGSTRSRPESASSTTCSNCSRTTADSISNFKQLATSTSISITPSKMLASCSGEASTRPRQQERHFARRILPDADGRNARPGGGRFLRTRRRGGRNQSARQLVGDLQTELVHDFFEGFARGARANVQRECCTAARTITRSKRSSRRSRARCAPPAGETAGWRD